jgi:hypothetical protein
MCLFVETHYPECKHTCFELYVFCHEILLQLNRINDPDQRDTFDLPFDPNCILCEPWTVIERPVGLAPEVDCFDITVRSNIVHRTMDMVEMCPGCSVKSLCLR